MLVDTRALVTIVSTVMGAPPARRWVSAVVAENAVAAVVRGGESNVLMLPEGQMEVDNATRWELRGPTLTSEMITLRRGRPEWAPCEVRVDRIEAAQWHPDGTMLRIAGQSAVIKMQLEAVRRVCGLLND